MDIFRQKFFLHLKIQGILNYLLKNIFWVSTYVPGTTLGT